MLAIASLPKRMYSACSCSTGNGRSTRIAVLSFAVQVAFLRRRKMSKPLNILNLSAAKKSPRLCQMI
ncbi:MULTISPECIES: hypothetical protein [unclassified Bradyrhizobium]|uniref:hypothetical protein n=1 Tax=unclassified Bradyrhizobium TaxID=2631580 RepID=UPI0012E33EF9|nr:MULTISPECIES: hypothetical protein [unclassified Bradyrhizobium]